MNHFANSNAKFKRVAITVLISIFTGFLAALWRFKLDPEGTGGNILAIPVILSLAAICTALFFIGLFTLKEPFGPFLVLASFLIPVSFFALNAFIISTTIQTSH